MKRIEKDENNAVIYNQVDNYGYKLQVIEDLDKSKKVIILSDKDDVLQYYGQLLNNYGQYNLYKIDDWDDVNEEFIDEVATRNQTKEEAVVYIGKPLSETVIEVINSLKLNDSQKRILSIVKDLIKGSDGDVKQQAALNLLNERLMKEKAENKQLKDELNEIKTSISQEQSSTQYTRSTIHLDTFLSNTQVIYIKAYFDVLYFNSLIENYRRYLETIHKLRAKIVIFDNSHFDLYDNDRYDKKISSLDDYMGNRSLFLNTATVISNQIYPLFINDLYKGDFDVLIFVDRILNNQSMVDGKNVHTIYNVGHKNELNYALNKKEKDPTINIISASRLNYKEGIIIPKIPKEIKNKQEEFYWYNKLGNMGNDNRLIFSILDDIRQPKITKNTKVKV